MDHNLKRTVRHDGIHAAAVLREGNLSVVIQGVNVDQANRDRWARTFQQVFNMVDALSEDQVRIGFGKTVINAMYKNSLYVAIGSEKGHGITKSLQRMLRRLMKGVETGHSPEAGVILVPMMLPEPSPAAVRAPDPAPASPSYPSSTTPSVTLPDDIKPKDPKRPW